MSVRSDSGCFCGFHIVFHVAHIGVKHVDCCAPQQSWLIIICCKWLFHE